MHMFCDFYYFITDLILTEFIDKCIDSENSTRSTSINKKSHEFISNSNTLVNLDLLALDPLLIRLYQLLQSILESLIKYFTSNQVQSTMEYNIDKLFTQVDR